MPRGHRASKWPPQDLSTESHSEESRCVTARLPRQVPLTHRARGSQDRQVPYFHPQDARRERRVRTGPGSGPAVVTSPRERAWVAKDAPRPWTEDCRPAPPSSPSAPCPAPGPHIAATAARSALLPEWPQCQGPGRKRRGGAGPAGAGGGAPPLGSNRTRPNRKLPAMAPGIGHSASRCRRRPARGIRQPREVGSPPNQLGARSTPQESCV